VQGKTPRELVWDDEGNLFSQSKEGYSNTYGYDRLNRITYAADGGAHEINTKDVEQTVWGSVERDVGGGEPLYFYNGDDPVKLDYHATSIGVDFQTVTTVNRIRLSKPTARATPRTVEVYTSTEGLEDSWTRLRDMTWVRDGNGVTLQLKEGHEARFVKLHLTWDERDAANAAVDNSTMSGAPSTLVQFWFTVNGRVEYWSYDAQGNRLSEEAYCGGSTEESEYSYYPSTNRIKEAGEWRYNYDANGNMVERGTAGTWDAQDQKYSWSVVDGELWRYGYDLRNRLVEVEHSGKGEESLQVVARYQYDIRDLRVLTSKNGEETCYQYDQEGRLLWRETGSEQRKYMEALGQIWAEVRSTGTESETYWHHTDHEGTTNVITDSVGMVVWDTDYEAFGAISRSNGTLDADGLYTGHELDVDTGLYYSNARWYDPQLGRFITEDPSRDGLNWYAYCYNNPLAFVDPTGLEGVFGGRAPLPGDKVPLVGSVNTGSKALDKALSGPFGVWNVFATAVNMPFNTAAAAEMGYNAGTKAVLGQEGFSGEGLSRDVELLGLYALQNPGAGEAAGAALRFITGGGLKLTEATSAGTAAEQMSTALVPRNFSTLAPNRGFLGGFTTEETLQPGAMIDRFGGRGGSFASPSGTPFSARALPPENALKPFEQFKVLQPMKVNAGIAGYAFGGGGGIQYELPKSIAGLLDDKLIGVVK
jgi:RHS repeat-associated protein